MKLSEMRDDAALDCCAEIIEPLAVILGDKEIASMLKSGQMLRAVKPIIKEHKAEIKTILAAMEGVPVEEYHPTVMSFPVKVIELLNDPEIKVLFQSQAQKTESDYSGSASENTEDAEN